MEGRWGGLRVKREVREGGNRMECRVLCVRCKFVCVYLICVCSGLVYMYTRKYFVYTNL